jgi:capsular polysaccharide biosynthesis protein
MLGSDYKFDSNMMNIISSATNLESIYSQSEVSVKKLQNEWHRAFISVNETLGVLEDKKARAEMGEKVRLGTVQEQVNVGGMSPSTKKNILIVVGVLVLLGVMLYFFKDSYEQTLGIELPF